jgi:hypothetical protein
VLGQPVDQPPVEVGSQGDADVYGRLTAADALTHVVELPQHLTAGGAVHVVTLSAGCPWRRA